MELTNENYFSKEAMNEYLSASYVKSVLNCEAAAEAERKGEYERPSSQALMVGSYVDAALTEDLAEWIMKHPEIRKRDGTLRAEYVQAQEMVDRAMSDDFFMGMLSGEHQKIITGQIGGLPFKAKLDAYLPDIMITDLKTVRDMNPVYLPGQGRVDFATAWNWPLQLAIYQELIRQETDKIVPCYLAVITKETPPDIEVISISQERLDAEKDFLMMKLPRIEAVRNGLVEPKRCGKCAYCRMTKKITRFRSLEEFEDIGGTEDE